MVNLFLKLIDFSYIYVIIFSTKKENFMKKHYFNTFEFRYALDLMEKNPEIAKLKFEEYIKNYPYDYSAYTYYITCLIILGNLEEAKRNLEYFKRNNYIKMNSKYVFNKIKHLQNNMIFCCVKLLCYQHKYDQLYQFCLDNFSIIDKLGLSSVFFYCKNKLNLIDTSSRIGERYLHRQMIEYKESDFLDHIKKHLSNFNKDCDNPNTSIFAHDFPINEVIIEIKNFIPSSKRLFAGFYDDTYCFRYDYCGKEKNKYTNYFKVICLHDTNNIITMCPSLNCENLPYIDLNYLKQNINEENTKVKKKSQIDKFNQRYKL